jgi:6-phosphogluconolactonase
VREPGLRETRVLDDLEALSRSVAETLEATASRAIASRGRFSIALAGGGTPRTLYELLARDFRSRISWSAWEIFFGDERCVAPYHPLSNYGMVAAALLSQVNVPERQVHRMEGELVPEEGARSYEHEMRRVLSTGPSSPVLDVALLGVGADGHTASLFPGNPALDERERWVLAVEAPVTSPPRDRITLTVPVLSAAREVYYLCAGAGKRDIVREILSESATGRSFPAARVRGTARTIWFLDREAGGND